MRRMSKLRNHQRLLQCFLSELGFFGEVSCGGVSDTGAGF